MQYIQELFAHFNVMFLLLFHCLIQLKKNNLIFYLMSISCRCFFQV